MARDCTEHIERSRKRIAKCLNLLEAVHGELEFVFEQNPDWNPDIKWQIDDRIVTIPDNKDKGLFDMKSNEEIDFDALDKQELPEHLIGEQVEII